MTEAGGIVGEFLALKEETDADLLAMQCGDFYEFFADDAETVAAELDLQVSQKSSHGSSYPMAGVPVDDLTPYVAGLVERGYRVAVADQYETDAGGHAREVTRVVTPGTLLATGDADAQYLAALVAGEDGAAGTYGVAFCDVTTGQFHVAQVGESESAASAGSGGSAGTADNGGGLTAAEAELLTELYRFDPVEVLPGPNVRTADALLDRLGERTDATLTLHTAEAFAPGRARHRVREQFGDETLASVGLADRTAAIRAAGAVLAYVEETGAGVLASITRLQVHGAGDHVELDATTQRNLELTETMQGERKGSLFATLDHTVTSAGARTLKTWLQRPRRARGTLERRQAAVGALSEAAMAREELRALLDGAYDLERLASRAASGSADARDLRAAASTLSLLPEAADLVAESPRLADAPLADRLAEVDRAAVADLAGTLDAALVDDPPGTVTQGGIIARGHDADLDDIVAEHEAALEWIDTLAEREGAATGITHLSVDRNTTDGYYIQVGNSEADKVPDHYRQIKDLKNHVRFTTEDLEAKERTILRLEERRHELERDLFEALRDRVAARAELCQDVGRTLAWVDALASLATHAVQNDWTRPELVEGSQTLAIEAGRHPVVEQATEFVPNDLYMDDERRFLVVTGPNMSGKSTYMRQAALVTLLAQIGSFVPARSARVGLVDGIYTRVGALDELAQGRSTFMVEMQELSNILHSASDESLVILDEVGRGTATYDGISIAWAATEYLHNEVGARTLFATHYHELTTLAEHLPRVENVHVAADESDGEVTFLRTVRDGPTDRSYGIHVADLAGVPAPVVDRSREVLDRLREEKAVEAKGGDSEPVQAVFDVASGEFRGESVADGGAAADGDATTVDRLVDEFGTDAEDVLEALSDLDVDETPPVEALARLQEWQARLDDE
jgi:DNA mismatch repair protein MutS